MERQKQICNAKITGTSLGFEDHGILTFWLYLEFQGGGCGFGGYCLQSYDRERKCEVYSGKGLEAIVRVMKTVGVTEWEKLKGQYIRVEHTGWGGKVTKIGNLMKEDWFSLEEFFKEETADYQL